MIRLLIIIICFFDYDKGLWSYILYNFLLVLDASMQVLIAMEKQKVAEKEAETRKKMAITEAEKNAQVSKILMQQKLMEKDSSRMQEEIENQMYMAREKSLADASFYRWKSSLYFSSLLSIIIICNHEVSLHPQADERSRSKQVEAYSSVLGAQIHWSHS